MPVIDTITRGTTPSATNDLLYSADGSTAQFGQGSSLHEAVAAPTLLNSWVNFGGSNTNAGYYKDPLGRVYLRGTVKSGTVGSGTPVFTLPAGYRPSAIRNFVVVSNGAFGQVDVDSSGNVKVIVGSNTWVSLEGISFDVP